MKVFDHIWLWLILLFAGYVVVAGTPEGRIVRVCEPVNWTGRLFESAAMLMFPEKALGVRVYMTSVEKGCHAMLYRQFYPIEKKAEELAETATKAAKDAAKDVQQKAIK